MTNFNKRLSENIRCLCGHVHRHESQLAACHRKVLLKVGRITNRRNFIYPKIRAYSNAPIDIKENIRVLRVRLRALKDREPEGISAHLTLDEWIALGCPDAPEVRHILEERFAEMIAQSGRDFERDYDYHQNAIDRLSADIDMVNRQLFR